MKLQRYRLLFGFLLLMTFSSCSSDDTFGPETSESVSPIELRVDISNFSTDGTPDTRAADISFTTVFQDGDRLGIVTSQPDGSKQHLCATYNGAVKAWEGIYYEPGVTYICSYFPYSEELTSQLGSISDASGVASTLKTLMPPLADQSGRDAYHASDLLTGTCILTSSSAGGKSLNVTLTHAYSLLLLQAGTEYTTSDGSYTYRAPLSDVQVTVDDALCCVPFVSAEGYRLIVDKKDAGSLSVEFFYTLADGKTYKVADNSPLTEGAYHLYRNVTSSGTRDLAIGDFYYSDGGIVPYDTDAPPSDGCIGVVYWLGNTASEEDMLLKQEFPGCTHGLVVALQDASLSTLWSSDYEDITSNWLNSQSSIYHISSLKTTDKMQGYANTRALEGYNASYRVTGTPSRKVLPIQAVKDYSDSHTAPANSSGWYWPSVKELKYICWGQDASSGTVGRDMLNQQFAKVQGTSPLQSVDYWSSTEDDYGWAWCVNFDYGNVRNGVDKDYYSFPVRVGLAF